MQQSTRSGSIFGALPYLSPELLRSRPADVRADLYALGAILYHMLAGAPPFGHDPQVICATQMSGRLPPSVRASRPEVSRGIDAVIRQALASDPERRFADPAAFATALEHGAFDPMPRRNLVVRFRALLGLDQA